MLSAIMPMSCKLVSYCLCPGAAAESRKHNKNNTLQYVALISAAAEGIVSAYFASTAVPRIGSESKVQGQNITKPPHRAAITAGAGHFSTES
jgi:hypothetical protein